MKRTNCLKLSLFALLALTMAAPSARAEIEGGSTGALADLLVSSSYTSSNPYVVTLPEDGQLHYQNVTVNGYLKFTKNQRNTPVYLLATGDIVVTGTIDVSASGKIGGPGGFDGGEPGFGEIPAGPGHGPGGANSSTDGSYNCGRFFQAGYDSCSGYGNAYGSPLLIPLVGGSGGSGMPGTPTGVSGTGGGGALLLAAGEQVAFSAALVLATGGDRGCCVQTGLGSGGAVRIVAPTVTGSVTINVRGGRNTWSGSYAAPGRVRIDAIDRSGLSPTLPYHSNGEATTAHLSLGTYLVGMKEPAPTVRIVSIGGQQVVGDTEPVVFGFNASPTQDVVIAADGFPGGSTNVYVRLEQASGNRPVLGPFVVTNGTPRTEPITFSVNNPTRVLVYAVP